MQTLRCVFFQLEIQEQCGKMIFCVINARPAAVGSFFLLKLE